MPGQRFHKARITLRRCTTHGQPTNHQTGLTNTYGHPLTRLAAVADPGIKGQIIADPANLLQCGGAITNQRRTLHRRTNHTILDPVGLSTAEHELAVGNIHLTTTKADRINTVFQVSD